MPLVIDYSLSVQIENNNKAVKILNKFNFMPTHYTQSLNLEISLKVFAFPRSDYD